MERSPDRSSRSVLELSVSTEDISKSTEWRIHQDRHAVIVHLSGTIRELETELEGCGAVLEPPMPGEAWIVPAGQRYVSHARGDTVRYAELYIDPKYFAELFGGRAPNDEIRPRAGVFDDFLYRSVEYLVRLMNANDDVSQTMSRALGQVVCLHVMREYRTATGPVRQARTALSLLLDSQKTKLLEEYIGSHMSERLSLEALSALAGMGIHDFLKAFRDRFGTTPAQYVIEQRLRRVRWLLSNSSKDIATIAVETGFSSHSHLSATFKARLRLTAREFRISRRGRR